VWRCTVIVQWLGGGLAISRSSRGTEAPIVTVSSWNCCYSCRFRVAPFYVDKNTTDFICSTPGYGGMTSCDEVPRFRLNGIECNQTLEKLFGLDLWNFTSDVSFNLSTSPSSCINWNAYYTDCRADSNNPFQGSISFDNIGLACIAIFQVSKMRPLLQCCSQQMQQN